jgi:hypothetical protein
MDLVLFGDRREAHNLPILLRQHMADQIVLLADQLSTAIHQRNQKINGATAEPNGFVAFK